MKVEVTPYKHGSGGIIAMPRMINIPQGREDWTPTRCPVCGAECWETELARQTMKQDPTLTAACTLCALRAGTK